MYAITEDVLILPVVSNIYEPPILNPGEERSSSLH